MSGGERELRYCPFYCEENVWHLVGEEHVVGGAELAKVVFISNAERACAFWCQRAASEPEEPVLWDYHVVLAVRHSAEMTPKIWDLDTMLGVPVPLDLYLDATFRRIPGVFWSFDPSFRLIDAARYRVEFSSDRSHMRDNEQRWMAPPPSWPPIVAPGTPTDRGSFLDWTAMTADDDDLLGLEELRASLGGGAHGW